MYDAAGAFKSFSERRPSARARTTQRRAAEWNLFLHLAEQNFFGLAPTFLAGKGAAHQKQYSSMFMGPRPSTAGLNNAHPPQGIRGFGLTPPHPCGVTVAVHPNMTAVARQEW